MRLALLALWATGALAQSSGESFFDDPALQRLVQQSLEATPELAQAQAQARAQKERVGPAGALPDPMLSVGVQNDGFSEWQVGMMETSYYLVAASQTFPWPGKRALRGQLAELDAKSSELTVERVRLSTEAEVRRAYLELLLVTERLVLLEQVEALWQKAAGVARTRYEAGESAQSDVLRSQLELNRLKQRRWSLLAQKAAQTQTLNRLRARPLGESVEQGSALRTKAVPRELPPEQTLAAALEKSPELRAAHLAQSRGQAALQLAVKGTLPDLTVNAALMPRGGHFEPMWSLSVGAPIPVFAGRKQYREEAQGLEQIASATKAAESLEQVIRLRVEQRRTALEAVRSSIALYQQGLLVQSQATADSTLAQYQVGRVSFASVLEANVGLINDEEGFLQSLAQAHRLAIAEAELSLAPVPMGLDGAAMPTGVPGAGTMQDAPVPSAGSTPEAPAASAAPMGGM